MKKPENIAIDCFFDVCLPIEKYQELFSGKLSSSFLFIGREIEDMLDDYMDEEEYLND